MAYDLQPQFSIHSPVLGFSRAESPDPVCALSSLAGSIIGINQFLSVHLVQYNLSLTITNDFVELQVHLWTAKLQISLT